jgi:hypothetical protein
MIKTHSHSHHAIGMEGKPKALLTGKAPPKPPPRAPPRERPLSAVLFRPKSASRLPRIKSARPQSTAASQPMVHSTAATVNRWVEDLALATSRPEPRKQTHGRGSIDFSGHVGRIDALTARLATESAWREEWDRKPRRERPATAPSQPRAPAQLRPGPKPATVDLSAVGLGVLPRAQLDEAIHLSRATGWGEPVVQLGSSQGRSDARALPPAGRLGSFDPRLRVAARVLRMNEVCREARLTSGEALEVVLANTARARPISAKPASTRQQSATFSDRLDKARLVREHHRQVKHARALHALGRHERALARREIRRRAMAWLSVTAQAISWTRLQNLVVGGRAERLRVVVERKMAVRIQCAWRQYVSRRDVQKFRAAVKTIRWRLTSLLLWRRHKTLRRNAELLRSFLRGMRHASRQRYLIRQFQRYSRAAQLIARRWKVRNFRFQARVAIVARQLKICDASLALTKAYRETIRAVDIPRLRVTAFFQLLASRPAFLVRLHDVLLKHRWTSLAGLSEMAKLFISETSSRAASSQGGTASRQRVDIAESAAKSLTAYVPLANDELSDRAQAIVTYLYGEFLDAQWQHQRLTTSMTSYYHRMRRDAEVSQRIAHVGPMSTFAFDESKMAPLAKPPPAPRFHLILDRDWMIRLLGEMPRSGASGE